MESINCICGNILNIEDIDTCRKCNEEGEDYTTIEYDCSNCKALLEFDEWGEIFDEEAKEIISEKL